MPWRTSMRVLEGTDVVQLDDVTALAATLNRAIAGDLQKHDISSLQGQKPARAIRAEFTHSQPVNLVRVGRETSATGVLLITRTLHDDGVLESSCTPSN